MNFACYQVRFISSYISPENLFCSLVTLNKSIKFCLDCNCNLGQTKWDKLEIINFYKQILHLSF